MATDFNITMKQYNGVDYDTLYPETKGSQIITPVPIASGGTNSNTASGAMNNLITALSTITPVGDDLIPFKDASGNTVGKATISSLASVLQSVGGYAKIQTGSYVGTGTYDSSNPCTLTFDFVPRYVIISKYVNQTNIQGTIESTYLGFSNNDAGAFFINGVNASSYNGYKNSNYFSHIVSWDGNILSFYSVSKNQYGSQGSGDAMSQLNESGSIYYYIGISSN